MLEELLYSALEDYKLDIIIGQGRRLAPTPRGAAIYVRRSDDAGRIDLGPLRSRFGIVLRLEFYTPEDLQVIVERSAEILGVGWRARARRKLPRRSRGTPRIANRLLRRVRDYAQVRGGGKIDEPTAKAALRDAGSRSVWIR